jgi:signal peptidase II
MKIKDIRINEMFPAVARAFFKPVMQAELRIPHFLVVLVLVAADQVIKHLVRARLPMWRSVRITSFLQISHVENTGIAFGFFHGLNILLIFVMLAIVCGLLLLSKRIVDYAGGISRICLVLILGGALGNLSDRIFFGRITDFLDFGIKQWHFPSFNFADSCISTGGVLLALIFLFRKPSQSTGQTTGDRQLGD